MTLARAGGLLLALVLAARAEAMSPASNYAVHCRGCHLEDGTATPELVPALKDSVGRFLRLPEGREFVVRVPGVAQAQLGDVELADLLNWTLRRFDPAGLPEDFVPYDAAEVGRLRRRPLTDVSGTRRALVERLERRAPPATAVPPPGG